ncbi:twitching motility protein PilI [Chitinivorax tropicus]|uniref:Twitching motility protein PilI n=1 Tax=Chitinivorax tropicus TaxID=714531 RepID=A0A840MS31_9PROT|nr:chemotaxis protein CheW [Chitinivorax tropicus]MBB5018021.1 twitching motility protein PilI [Chitinivorax tropicus]
MAKKISLREYQESVVAKLQSSLASSTAAASKLGLQIGNERWVVDLQDTSEVVAVTEIEPVPLTQSWFRGVTNVRGNLYSVIDLPAFFGGEFSVVTSSSRLLLVNPHFIASSALLVTRMLGLRGLQSMEAVEVPPDSPPWLGGRLRDQDGIVWNVLNISALTTNPQFLQVAA